MLNVPLSRTMKLLAVMARDDAGIEIFTILLLRGDHTLNEIKANKVAGLSEFRFANVDEIKEYFNCPAGFLGPVGLRPLASGKQPRVIADRAIAAASDFICGANKPKYHLAGVNFGRDLPEPDLVADIRNVVTGDASPDGQGTLELCRGIEVGHIFQLRTKYSQDMNATYLDENGASQVMEMGCYGIGVSRIVGAAIEQGNDEKGIIFPLSMAPFSVVICPIGMDKSEAVKEAATNLYQTLQAAGVEVLLDDRGERPGVMFAEMDLIGIPHRIVIGERGLAEGQVEYKGRTDAVAQNLVLAQVDDFVKSLLN